MYTARGPCGFSSRAARQAGFSLVELLVSLIIMAEILIGLLILFDNSNKLARAQTQVAEIQQSLRVGQSEVVRFARMAGIGGLPITRLVLPGGEPADPGDYTTLLGAFPRSGYAVSVLNDVPHVTIVEAVNPGAATPGTDFVLPRSDVLIVRGVFSTPLYYVDPQLDLEDPIAGPQGVCIPERVRVVGDTWEDYPQDTTLLGGRLQDAETASVAVALSLRDTLNPNAYGIFEFDHDNLGNVLTPTDCDDVSMTECVGTAATAFGTPQCIQFFLDLDETAAPGDGYANLSTGTILQAGGHPVVLDPGPPVSAVEYPTAASSIGLLEEFRFFVRVEHEVPGNAATRLTPVLSRASFLPGTDEQIDRVDIADNVIDLQIAIGVDDNDDGLVTEDTSGAGGDDEILYNHANDTTSSVSPYAYREPAGAVTWYDTEVEFHFLRINTLVQARFPSRDQIAPNLGTIEDLNRGLNFTVGTENYQFNTERLYQRRWLQTVVALRNPP
ncbi:MAG: hypothetical protein GY778_28235 [bacterium]|nr:hypothetical protein [bacterium]